MPSRMSDTVTLGELCGNSAAYTRRLETATWTKPLIANCKLQIANWQLGAAKHGVLWLLILHFAICNLQFAICESPSAMCLAQEPDKLVRPPDDRRDIDVKQVETFGIRMFESRRLRLFSDIEPDLAKTLPPLADQAFEAHEKYFGKMLPDRDGRDYQINGYLMRDKAKFAQAGLLHKELQDQVTGEQVTFHGRQIGHQFWMMDQGTDYYRRHMLLHEATHAFMQAIPNIDMPLMYLEGMAEHFGTHRLASDGKLELGVVPHNRADFRGHDRLFLIRRDVQRRGIPTLRAMREWQPGAYREFNVSYAWSWGACLFLSQSPRTRERFRETARSLTDPLAGEKLLLKLKPDWPEIITEWNLFAAEAWEGFDFDRMAIEFRDGQRMSELVKEPFGAHRVEIRTDRGWQSGGLLVEKGRQYALSARGQFTLADQPKPWLSEAEGITFRYHNGRPLGRLLVAIRSPKDSDDQREPMLDVNSLGASGHFDVPRTGTLYLRLNDHPGELANNRGSVNVEIRDVGQAPTRAAP